VDQRRAGPNDDAIVNAGSVLLTNATAGLASFTLNGGTLTCSNWLTSLTASNVWLNGGTVTLPAAFTNNGMSNRVWVVCTNLFVRGRRHGQCRLERVLRRDRGLPARPRAGAASRQEATRKWRGYGGRAGDTSTGGKSGNPYGRRRRPSTRSGGATAGGPGTVGGHGGGAVRIDGRGTVPSTASSAPRQRHDGVQRRPGSGGAIYIGCRVFAGTAASFVREAATRHDMDGGGGGGRIAVEYDPAFAERTAQAHGRFPGARRHGQAHGRCRDDLLPDARVLPTLITNNVNGQLEASRPGRPAISR